MRFFCKLYTLKKLDGYTFTFRYSLASKAFPLVCGMHTIPNGFKTPFFQNSICIGKFSYYIFLNLVYNESLYYLLYALINLIFGGKILVPEILTKVLLANQIAGFLNQLYL